MVFAGRRVLILSGIAIFLLLMVAFLYGPLSSLQIDSFYANHISYTKDCGGIKGNMTKKLWTNFNVRRLQIPKAIKEQAIAMEVVSKEILLNNITIHFRTVSQIRPKKLDVLLLHGQSFDSKAWEKLFTIQTCTALGYRTIAVDMPGFGHSQRASISYNDNFIYNFITTMDMVKPVIISPSMSGLYSIPYILKHSTTISGFVPVSPVYTSLLEKLQCASEKKSDFKNLDSQCSSWMKEIKKDSVADLSCKKVPTMVVCGGDDDKDSSARLCHLPFSKGAEIPHGQHAAYLTDPDLWHEFLYNFLSFLNGC